MNSQKNKIYLYLLAAIAITALVSFFIVIPAFDGITKAKAKIIQEKENLEEKLKLNIDLEKTKNDLSEIEMQMPVLQSIFIIKGQELAFVSNLEKLAQINNLVMNINSDFQGEGIGNDINQASLELNLIGDYSDIIKFIESIEKSTYYYTINNIDIAPDNSQKLSSVVKARISGSIYIVEPNL